MNTAQSSETSWLENRQRAKAACDEILPEMDKILGKIDPDFTGWKDDYEQMIEEAEAAIKTNPDIKSEELQEILRLFLETRGRVEFLIQNAINAVDYAKLPDGSYHARPVLIARGNTLRKKAREILELAPDVGQEALVKALQIKADELSETSGVITFENPRKHLG